MEINGSTEPLTVTNRRPIKFTRRRSFATVIVGPCALRREGLTSILAAADFRIVASASCVDDVVLTVRSQRRSILLIVDAGNDLDATIRQIERFKQRHPAARVAVLADRDTPSDIASAFRVGANAYFVDVVPSHAFIKSLELVILGETILPAAILPAIVDDPDHDKGDHEHGAVVRDVKTAGEALEAERNDNPKLSVRERSILNCLIDGYSNKAIARKIGISDATVKVHVKAILRKARLRNRTQAAIWAMSNGLSVVDNRLPAFAKAARPPVTPHLHRVLSASQENEIALLPPVVEPVEAVGQDDRSPM
jgi:two-component system nitrate/nitrite response regulator NarL